MSDIEIRAVTYFVALSLTVANIAMPYAYSINAPVNAPETAGASKITSGTAETARVAAKAQ